MGDHATCAPSAAHRWLRCAGSVNFTAGLPDEAGEAAREGTFAHGIAARCLTENREPAEFIGETDGEFTCDEDMARAVSVYVDFIESLWLQADVSMIEQRVRFSDENHGTADAIAVCGNTLHVADLKFGRTFVAAAGNEQLLNYAAAALLTLGDAAAGIDRVCMHIVQPRDGSENPIRTMTRTASEVREWASTVLAPGVAATADPKARLVPGEVQCQYCPGKATCPALRAHALDVARDVFPDADDLATHTAPPPPSTMSPQQLSVALKALPLLREWADAIEAHALAEARAGRAPEGWKLVQKIGNRKWRDEKEAEAHLRAGGADPFERKLLSPAKAEKALGGGKDARAFVAELTVRPVTGDSLQPLSDKRPALVRDGAAFPDL